MFDEMLVMASRAAKDPKTWKEHRAGADRNLKNFQKSMELRFNTICDQMDKKYETASKHVPNAHEAEGSIRELFFHGELNTFRQLLCSAAFPWWIEARIVFHGSRGKELIPRQML
jgi:hypothetical protein